MLEDIAGAVVDLAAGLVALYEGDVEVPDARRREAAADVEWALDDRAMGAAGDRAHSGPNLGGHQLQDHRELLLVLEAVLSSDRTRPASSRR
jgi:hypothetical protein